MARLEPLSALPAALAFPSGDFGPVDRLHGFHRLISSDCRTLRSEFQPFAMRLLQY